MPLTRRQYQEAVLRAEPFDYSLTHRSQKLIDACSTRDIRLIVVNVAAYDYTNSPHRCVPHNLRPPIGLFSLQAALLMSSKWTCDNVCVIDMERDRLAPVDLAALIAKVQSGARSPIIVGLNGYSPNRAIIEKVVSTLNRFAPEVQLLIGGRLISIELDPREKPVLPYEESILANVAEGRTACAVIGEGERLLPLLADLQDWHPNTPRAEPALAWWSKDVVTLPSKFESLTAEALSRIKYRPPTYTATAGGGEPYYAMLSSRSCPFHCSFCAANYFPVRVLPTSFIEEEIMELSAHSRTVRIDFCDDNVLMTEKRSREFIEMMERLHERGIRVIWRALARGDSVLRLERSGYIKRAANAGLEEVAIGMETTSDRLLKQMCKELTFSDIDGAVESLGRSNIRAKMFALIGIPTETENEAAATIRYLLDRAQQGHRWSLFVQAPYAGTADHRGLMEKGWTYWDLQLYTEAASRGGALIAEVDNAGIQLGNPTLAELYGLVDEVTGTCSYKVGGGEDCCAASCDAASQDASSAPPHQSAGQRNLGIV